MWTLFLNSLGTNKKGREISPRPCYCRILRISELLDSSVEPHIARYLHRCVHVGVVEVPEVGDFQPRPLELPLLDDRAGGPEHLKCDVLLVDGRKTSPAGGSLVLKPYPLYELLCRRRYDGILEGYVHRLPHSLTGEEPVSVQVVDLHLLESYRRPLKSLREDRVEALVLQADDP